MADDNDNIPPHDDDEKPSALMVVSGNPNARTDRQIAEAKEEAQRTLPALQPHYCARLRAVNQNRHI